MENIKHRKFTISFLTSLACFNVLRQRWAAKAALSWGSSSSCCNLTLPRRLFCRDPSWQKKDHMPLEPPTFTGSFREVTVTENTSPTLTDHPTHVGTSGMAKACERRLLVAAPPASATDPAASTRNQCSPSSRSPCGVSSPRGHSSSHPLRATSNLVWKTVRQNVTRYEIPL